MEAKLSDEASWRLDDEKFQFKLQWFVLYFANCSLVFYLCILGTSLQGKNCITLYNWGIYSRVPIARGFLNIRHGFIVASHIDLRYKAVNDKRLWQNSFKTKSWLRNMHCTVLDGVFQTALENTVCISISIFIITATYT